MKRKLDSLEDCSNHKKRKDTEGFKDNHRVKRMTRGDKSREKKADRDQEIKKLNTKRKEESMEDNENHKRRKVDGVKMDTEHKRQKNGNDREEKKRMRMDCFNPIMDRIKKRKQKDTEEDKNQNKKRKTQDTEEHRNQDNKRKTTEDLQKQVKKSKSENSKEQKKPENMECCKRLMNSIKKCKRQVAEGHDSHTKKRKKEDTEDHESQAKKRNRQDTEEQDSQAKRRKREDAEDHEGQAKKLNRQDTEKQDSQAKKRRREDAEDHESQAKKRNRQDTDGPAKQRKGDKKVPKKKRPLECCHRILHCLRKRWRDSEDVLRLKLEAERVKEKRSVSGYRRVHMEEGNMVDATVRGHPCLVLFDTGSSVSTLVLSLGQRLGIVTGREETVKIRINTWIGVLQLDVIKLDEVVVVLKGGVVVNTPLVVFPQDMEMCYSAERIVMSMSRLQEAEMRQEFHLNGSSSLFLRHPERLWQRYETRRKGKVFTFAARTPGIEEPLTVLVDTGTDIPFCITKTGLDKVRRRTDRWTLPPGRVRLQFDSGTDILRDIKNTQARSFFHFVLGRPLLYQLHAVIDYVDSSITLSLKRKQFRLNLLSR
ncbi:trichohyalin-like [Scylla paramamosain]|uniref:trichohyalin-like n=1 Tax=Scylla paramamosain TaxID=85552 RepID=UPI003083B925